MVKYYMKKNKIETKEDRAQRKAIWIARATSHFDTDEIRKEASDIFEEKNPYCKQ